MLALYIHLKELGEQVVTRKEIKVVIMSLLARRAAVNRLGGKIAKLSKVAVRALEKQKLDKSYWSRFFAKRPELQQGKAITVSQKRTGACTQPVAEKHIADFCVEAKTLGIMDEAGKIADGSQVLNTDETPQQRAYAQARRNEMLAGAKGHSVATMTNEQRECATITPVINLAGYCLLLQIIFKQIYIPQEQVNAQIKKLYYDAGVAQLLSCTESGYQTTELVKGKHADEAAEARRKAIERARRTAEKESKDAEAEAKKNGKVDDLALLEKAYFTCEEARDDAAASRPEMIRASFSEG
ncbi:hypothetical protein T492DRAFT_244240 [Pavlovales sp. CCMP2436]|nr:hypothetical protein T492DRAFT_244240 [Pavlovales sp. CCMP2436]